MELIYKYNNGIKKNHTTFISKKNIMKECEDATQVAIYKIHANYKTEQKTEYITTLLLK